VTNTYPTKTAHIAALLAAGEPIARIAEIVGMTRNSANAIRHRILTGYVYPAEMKRRAARANSEAERLALLRKTTDRIPLTQGFVAFIDPDDFDLVITRRWYAHCEKGLVYAWSFGATRMHRFIVGAGPGQLVDHRDGNTLNNRRSNLRLATTSQNGMNSKGWSTGTKFKGIYWYKATGQWTGQVKGRDGLRHSIGYHDDEINAALARDRVAIRVQGEYARLNFSKPEDVAAERAARQAA
jgi:hypothetical protein